MLVLSVMAARSRGKDGLGRGLLVLWFGHGVNLTHPSDSAARYSQRSIILFVVSSVSDSGCRDPCLS